MDLAPPLQSPQNGRYRFYVWLRSSSSSSSRDRSGDGKQLARAESQLVPQRHPALSLVRADVAVHRLSRGQGELGAVPGRGSEPGGVAEAAVAVAAVDGGVRSFEKNEEEDEVGKF